MAREKKVKVKRGRSGRVRSSRKEKPLPIESEDRSWILRSKNRSIAVAILNSGATFSFWASIEKDGPALVSHYFPSSHFIAGGRVYHGFVFRHHREDFLEQHVDARREYTDVALMKRREI